MTAVNSPQISVDLFKTVTRSDGTIIALMGNFTYLNLTPYLTEGSLVTTNKAINNPNGGFTIRLADQIVPVFKDSIYAMIEPMDIIEIRMSRVGEPLMVMRGIVTDTSLVESIGSDGRPSRMVTIKGGDCGCILRMIQIYFLKGSQVKDLVSQMSGQYLHEMFGIKYMEMSGGEFVYALVNTVINAFINEIANPALPPLDVDYSGADPIDTVYPNGLQANPQGTMWSHIQNHGNLGPFYEMLIEDSPQATTLVYRKPPYKAVSTGAYIFPKTSAESFDLPPREITSITRARSEHDVSNFYYVRNSRAELLTSIDTTLQSIIGDGSKLSKKTYPNCEERLYGFRAMEVNTNHSAPNSVQIPGQNKSRVESSNVSYAEYMLKQIKYLQDCNVDNVLFESGTIQCQGSPEFKPGMYFETNWGRDNLSSGYVTSVTHTFEPFRTYTCTLQYIRGTGFVQRSQAWSPYFYGSGVYE